MFGAFDFYSKVVLVPWTGAAFPGGATHYFPSSIKGILIKNSDAVSRNILISYYTPPFIDEFGERTTETITITVAPTSNLVLPIKIYDLSKSSAPNGVQVYELY